MGKKAQANIGIGSIEVLITTLVIAAIFLGFGIFTMGKLTDTVGYSAQSTAFNNFTTQYKMNETVNSSQASLIGTINSTLANCRIGGAIVTNATSGRLIDSGNYSFTGCKIYVSTISASVNNSFWNVSASYIYDNYNAAGFAMLNVTSALGGMPDWFGVLIAAAIIVILIGVLYWTRGNLSR